MPIPAKHIIQRQTVWLDQPPIIPAFVLQERLSAYCRDTLPGVLESVFDGVADADTVMRLDTLDLDAGTVSLARFEEQLTQRIRQRAEQELNRLLNNRKSGDTRVERYSRTDRLEQQFWFFLHHGHLPTWADTEAVTQFSNWLMSELAGSFRRELRSVLPNNPSVARRLTGHCSDTALMSVFSPTTGNILAENLVHFFRAIHQTINHLSLPVIREKYWLSRFRAGDAAGLTDDSYLTDFYALLYRVDVAVRGKTDPLAFFKTLFRAVDSGTKTMPSTDKKTFTDILQQLINQAISHKIETPEKRDQEPLTDVESASQPDGRSADTRSESESVNAESDDVQQNPSATGRDARSKPKPAESELESSRSGNQPNRTIESPSGIENLDNEAPMNDVTATELSQSPNRSGPADNPPMYVDSLEQADANRTDSVSKSAQKPTKQEQPETPSSESELYVSMAGIVLLHPFLTTLFTEMALIHNRLWISSEASTKGVQTLAWLATGTDFCAEYTMPLLKLLCGLPFETVVSPDIALTDAEKQFTTEVLEAVLTHWDVLKNTSPAGLQEAFLQREGKLIAVDGGWRLMIDRKTVDILLDKLPWGISMVKLPWMPRLLFIDWI